VCDETLRLYIRRGKLTSSLCWQPGRAGTVNMTGHERNPDWLQCQTGKQKYCVLIASVHIAVRKTKKLQDQVGQRDRFGGCDMRSMQRKRTDRPTTKQEMCFRRLTDEPEMYQGEN